MAYKNNIIAIPVDAEFIMNKLKKYGFKAYIVGGCVRDSLLGKTPKDWDINTNATPDKVLDIFLSLGFNVIETGLKHGTVTVMLNNVGYEITTFRTDGEYEDNRHPNNVEFSNDLREDLSRRDFTMNALAYNKEDGLIDYFNGLNDINNKVIRCVGDSNKRLKEDALRILRAFRFSAELGFIIDKDIIQSSIMLIDNIKYLSKERVSSEINKILLSDSSKTIAELFKLGILDYFIPEMSRCIDFEQNNKYHNLNVFDHIIKSVDSVKPKIHLKLAMLFHDIEKPQFYTVGDDGVGHFYGHAEASAEKSREILKRLKYDNKTTEKVYKLILFHDREIGNKKSIKKLLNLIGDELFIDLLEVKRADIYAQNPDYYNERARKLDKIESIYNGILQNKECVSIEDLDINGKDLINLGFKQGKDIGIILNNLMVLVLENPDLNNKEYLMKYVINNIESIL